MRLKCNNIKNRDLIYFVTISLLFCLIVAFSQPINPFPEDGWFQSQYRLIGQFTGQGNYTPIAAPAILYASIHYLSSIFGLPLEAEFYLGSIAHSLLLFISGVFIYLSNRMLRVGKIGFLCSLVLVVYMGSTFITQSFYSENLTFFLMSAVLYITVIFYCQTRILFKNFCFPTILFGLLLGLFIITRVLPIIILPGVLLLLWFRFGKIRFIFFSIITTFLVFSVVMTAMTANYYRFGRFELSDSTGSHIWNAVSPMADVMLAESSEYQSIKKYIPDIQGKMHWEINRKNIKKITELRKQELLKKLSFDAITNKPILFVSSGIDKLREFLPKPPRPLGLWGSKDKYNPLNVDSFLSPIVPQLEPFNKVLNSKFYSWNCISSIR